MISCRRRVDSELTAGLASISVVALGKDTPFVSVDTFPPNHETTVVGDGKIRISLVAGTRGVDLKLAANRDAGRVVALSKYAPCV